MEALMLVLAVVVARMLRKMALMYLTALNKSLDVPVYTRPVDQVLGSQLVFLMLWQPMCVAQSTSFFLGGKTAMTSPWRMIHFSTVSTSW